MAKADDASSTTTRSLLLEAVEIARSHSDRKQAIRNLELLLQTLQRLEAGVLEMRRRVSASQSAVQSSMRLTAWMLDQIQAAKRNPKHKAARVWLGLLNKTPKQIAEMLPYLIVICPTCASHGARAGKRAAFSKSHRKWSSNWTSASRTRASRRPPPPGMCSPNAATKETSKAGPTTWCGVEKHAFKSR